MTKSVELRRHTAADGDVLTADGVEAAVRIGRSLAAAYDIVISSGAQRATQTIACLLAGGGSRVEGGVVVDSRWRSDVEDRWKAAYQAAGAGDIESFRRADAELVDRESQLLGEALSELFERLPESGRALVVGHSPMHEVAVYGLTGKSVDPLSKGAGVLVTQERGSYEIHLLA
ncbi:MAG: histidine phosphatase family protein [Actinomycetota bacterium]